MPKPYNVFIVYARKDAEYLEELRGHLRPMERAGMLKIWCDREIDAGAKWEEAILHNMDTADIILLMVSAAYYDSSYIHEKELKYAIERHVQGIATVIPVIVRPCNFKVDPIVSSLQALPKDAKPVTAWPNRDDAWLDVVNSIQKEVENREKSEQYASKRAQEAADEKKRAAAAETERQRRENEEAERKRNEERKLREEENRRQEQAVRQQQELESMRRADQYGLERAKTKNNNRGIEKKYVVFAVGFLVLLIVLSFIFTKSSEMSPMKLVDGSANTPVNHCDRIKGDLYRKIPVDSLKSYKTIVDTSKCGEPYAIRRIDTVMNNYKKLEKLWEDMKRYDLITGQPDLKPDMNVDQDPVAELTRYVRKDIKDFKEAGCNPDAAEKLYPLLLKLHKQVAIYKNNNITPKRRNAAYDEIKKLYNEADEATKKLLTDAQKTAIEL